MVGGAWAGQGSAESGHETVPYAADLRIEAWSPTVEGCIAEAVRGMVESFAACEIAERSCVLRADSAADLLAAALDEVICRLDVDGELPLDTTVEEVHSGIDGTSAAVRFTGPRSLSQRRWSFQAGGEA